MSIIDKLSALGDMPDRSYSVLAEDGRLLYIEHCLRVSGCGENLIELSVYGCTLKITGLQLSLENFGSDGIKITGILHSITWEAQ